MTKGPQAFRTISESSDELGVPQHVLRFWETKFSFIRPMKRAGGRRFYRPQDLEVLRGVRVLLHDDGYTIKGVQRLHKEHGVRRLVAAALAGDHGEIGDDYDPADRFETAEVQLSSLVLGDEARERLTTVLDELEATKARIDQLLHRG